MRSPDVSRAECSVLVTFLPSHERLVNLDLARDGLIVAGDVEREPNAVRHEPRVLRSL